MKRNLVLLAATLLVGAGTARAQEQKPVEIEPGVARLSLIHGDVNTQRGDSGDWVAATLNTPVVVGDRVATGPSSRAELQLDYSNVLRLSENASAKVANLDRTQIQVQVGQGLVTYSVLKGNEASAEIDTPNVAVHPLSTGEYRIEVTPDNETRVIVRDGAAEVSTPQGSTRVDKGQLITIQGTDNPQYQVSSAPGKDEWDSFNKDRDHRISDAESWRHTDHYYVGSQDLDTYGHWRDVPDYGAVWVPAEPVGWVPYRDGRWVWEPYYGWTWVSYEPWGWAPYHYGRWFLEGGDWCWWPGPVYAEPFYRPIWAPAYVSFFGFGFGHHFGFGFGFGFGGGFGSVGWLPIGPGDGFFPWYGRSVNRVNVVNVTNITNITNVNNGGIGIRPMPALATNIAHPISNVHLALTNAAVRNGLSTMPTNQFGQTRVPIRQTPLDPGTLRQGGVMTGAVPVTPTSQSLHSTSQAVKTSALPRNSTGSQRFFTRTQAAPAPEAFSQRAAQVQKMVQNTTMNPSAGTQAAQSHPAPVQPRQTPATETRSNAAARTSAAPAASAQTRPGWHSFGSGNTAPSAPRSMETPKTQSEVRGSSTPTVRKMPNTSSSTSSGWHTFQRPQSSTEAPARPSQVEPRGPVNSNPAPRGTPQQPPARTGSQGGWQHFSGPPASSRPALEMRQPIVTERSAPQRSYSNSPRYEPPARVYSGGSSSSNGGYRGGGYSGPYRGGASNGGYASGGYRGAGYGRGSSGGGSSSGRGSSGGQSRGGSSSSHSGGRHP